MAHDAEHPPGAGGGEKAVLVVADDAVTIAEAEAADARGELLRRGQHVGQVDGGVGDVVDIEEPGAGDVVGVIGLAAGTRGVRHEPGAVQHPYVGGGEV